jgi:hypothetical protein
MCTPMLAKLTKLLEQEMSTVAVHGEQTANADML